MTPPKSSVYLGIGSVLEPPVGILHTRAVQDIADRNGSRTRIRAARHECGRTSRFPPCLVDHSTICTTSQSHPSRGDHRNPPRPRPATSEPQPAKAAVEPPYPEKPGRRGCEPHVLLSRALHKIYIFGKEDSPRNPDR
jgi:hypothetical protein